MTDPSCIQSSANLELETILNLVVPDDSDPQSRERVLLGVAVVPWRMGPDDPTLARWVQRYGPAEYGGVQVAKEVEVLLDEDGVVGHLLHGGPASGQAAANDER